MRRRIDAVLRLGWPDYVAARWFVAILALLAIAAGSSELRDAYQDYFIEAPRQPFVELQEWFTRRARDELIASAILLVIAAVAPLALRRWMRPTWPEGHCQKCGYDLTGNVSGTCPECGQRIVKGAPIPRRFERQDYYWLPELALFPDAQARYEAWRDADQEYSLSCVFVAGIVGGLLWVVLLVVAGIISETYAWVGLSFVWVPIVAAFLVRRTLIRRSLRRQLQTKRQSVLMCVPAGNATQRDLVGGTAQVHEPGPEKLIGPGQVR